MLKIKYKINDNSNTDPLNFWFILRSIGISELFHMYLQEISDPPS